jgi:hypothetical protein
MFRLLMGPHGALLRQIVGSSSRLTHIRKAMAWIRHHYTDRLDFKAVPALAGMSVSVFYDRFKSVAAVSPLQYQKYIFGVALGFGSQTLVKDISGVFYMFDDAFRVGEYIQSKSYKGTVEGFSLRSVRLRHHRGPVFTVPRHPPAGFELRCFSVDYLQNLSNDLSSRDIWIWHKFWKTSHVHDIQNWCPTSLSNPITYSS